MDKLQFAKLVAFVAAQMQSGSEVDDWFIDQLDRLCQFSEQKVNATECRIMIQMLRDDKWVEAIKCYRALTGDSLRESKDAIESVRKPQIDNTQ